MRVKALAVAEGYADLIDAAIREEKERGEEFEYALGAIGAAVGQFFNVVAALEKLENMCGPGT